MQSGLTAGVPISTERKLFRSDTKPMYYRIRGPKRSYLLYSGENDGNADKYGKGDMWFLHWHDGQIRFRLRSTTATASSMQPLPISTNS